MTDSTNQLLYGVNNSSKSMYFPGNEEDIAARWDKKAYYWDKQLQDANNHLNQDDAYQTFILLAKRVIDNGRWCECDLIDVGCGTGLVAQALSSDCRSITGVDISTEMLKHAQEKKLLNAKFLQHSIFELPASLLGLYDLVISRGVLISHYDKEYASKIFKALCKLCRDKNSMAIIDFLNHESDSSYQHMPSNKQHYHKSEVRKFALDCGFSHCEFIGGDQQRTLFAIMKF